MGDSLTTLKLLGLRMKVESTMAIDSVLRDIYVHDVALKKVKVPEAEPMTEFETEPQRVVEASRETEADNENLVTSHVNSLKRLTPIASFQYSCNDDLISFLTQRKVSLSTDRAVPLCVNTTEGREALSAQGVWNKPMPVPAKRPLLERFQIERNNTTELEQYRQLSEIRQWRDEVRRHLNETL